MNPLPHEIELQKVLDAIKEVAPSFEVPPIYMFQFIERTDRRGDASSVGEIRLSMRTIGEFNCKNEQFVKTTVHEVVHLNYWEDNHNENFQTANNLIFRKVWTKLNEKKSSIKTTD